LNNSLLNVVTEGWTQQVPGVSRPISLYSCSLS